MDEHTRKLYCLLFTTEQGNAFARMCAERVRDRVLDAAVNPAPDKSQLPTFIQVTIKHIEGCTTQLVCVADEDARVLLRAANSSVFVAECVPELFVDVVRFPQRKNGVVGLNPYQLRALHDAGVPLPAVRLYDCITTVDSSGYVPLRDMHKLDGVGQSCFFPVLSGDTFEFDFYSTQ